MHFSKKINIDILLIDIGEKLFSEKTLAPDSDTFFPQFD